MKANAAVVNISFNILTLDGALFSSIEVIWEIREALVGKTVTKGDIVHHGASAVGGRATPAPFLSPNLPDSQITQKWTFDTTI